MLGDDHSLLEHFATQVGEHFHARFGGAGSASEAGERFASVLLADAASNAADNGGSLLFLDMFATRSALVPLLVPSLNDYGSTQRAPIAELAELRDAVAGRANVSQADTDADIDEVEAEINRRLTHAENKTDFRNLARLQADRANLSLIGQRASDNGLGRASLKNAHIWIEADSFEDLGYNAAPELGGSERDRFASIWLASDRATRLGWLGLSEQQWVGMPVGGSLNLGGASDQIVLANLFRETSRALDRNGFDHVREHLTNVTGWVGGLDLPVLSTLAQLESNIIGGGIDMLELAHDSASNIAAGLREDGLDGGFKAALANLQDALLTGVAIDWRSIAILINADIDIIESTFHQVESRGLSQAEKQAMQLVFGNAIDYGDVVISTGGSRTASGMDSHVVGNQIHLADTYEGEAVFRNGERGGELTAKGYELLAHEMTHVWQYQKQGTGYIGEALVARPLEGEEGAYDWVKALNEGKSFVEMNVEQQGDVAEMIYEVISVSGDFSRVEFNRLYSSDLG